MVRAVLACAALLGCNRVLGLDPAIEIDASADQSPDLDGDHIPDDIDPCISSALDLAADFDLDQSPNQSDPCPFDQTGVPDADHDGIPDVCDPFPNDAGDEQRCVLAFHDPVFTATFWHSPFGKPLWVLNNDQLLSIGDNSVRVAESIEAPDVTVYDVFGSLQNGASTARVRFFVRGSETPTDLDAGCQLDGGFTSGHLVLLGDHPMSVDVAARVFDTFRMRITVEPGQTTNLRCELELVSSSVRPTVSGNVTLGPGVFSVAVEGGPLGLDAIAVYHRSDARPL